MSTNGKPKKIVKPWMIWLLVAIVALGGILFWMNAAQKKDDSATIETVPVERQDMTKKVAATGTVVANFEVEIKAKASGEIIRLPYDVSDTVKKGDLLVELNPIDENRNVSQALASLSGTRSKMSQSELNLQVARQTLQTDIAKANADLSAATAKQQDANSKNSRAAELVVNRYISQEEYETTTSTAAQARTDLENARIRLRELKTQQLSLKAQAQDLAIASADARVQQIALATSQQRLSETRIYAPISGVITSRLGQIGQIVASGVSNVGGGTAIMTLADLSHIFVLASVDESDIGQVREGQAVSITADAYPGETFQGHVVRISPKGIEETNVVTFEVKIEVDSKNKQLLKPLMTTNVEILIQKKAGVLTVPADAVMTGERGSLVQLLGDDKKVHRRKVEVGLNDGVNVEVLSGVHEGDKIVTSQKELRSKWKKSQKGDNPSLNNRRGQQMMMRGMGGGGRR